MIGAEQYRHSHYYTPRMVEMRHLFTVAGLESLAIGLAQLFVPIYLLNLGYSFPEVTAFMLVMFAAAIPVTYLGARLVSKINPNWLTGAGDFCTVTFFLGLAVLPEVPALFWAVPVLKAFDKGLYWPSYHLNFSKARRRGKTGAEVGLMSALVITTHGIAPAIGGLTASEVGITTVYVAAAVLMFVSALILFRSPDLAHHRSFKPSLLSRRIIPDLISSASYSSLYVVESYIWPILVFLVIPSYAGVGLLSSVVILASAAVALFTGKREDKRDPTHYIKQGSAVATITHFLRSLVETGLHVFGVNLVGGMGHSMLGTAMLDRYYHHTDREPRLEYVWAMETAHLAAYSVFFAVLWGLSLAFPMRTVLIVGLLLAAAYGLGVRKMR